MDVSLRLSQPTREDGFFILEVLVVTLLFSILAYLFAQSILFSLSVRGRDVRRQIATELVLNQLEHFAAVNPNTLSDADDLTENVSHGNFEFTRVVDVTANSDGSRTVMVRVSDLESHLPVDVSALNTFSLWGTQ